jgi:capsular polysaccharide biosynthesis protein
MSSAQTVYVLANRGNNIFGHWFLLVISGLYDLSHLPKPIKFHTAVELDFQRETLALLKPDFEFVENIDGYTIIHHDGAQCIMNYAVDDHYYHFLREQILVKKGLESKIKPFRRIYISRSKSHLVTYPIGAKRRQLVNEHILTDMLKARGFECIYLEDYSLVDKIRIFQESDVIVTPNGGALICCYFANKNTKIISITCPNPAELHYYHMCKVLSIPFYFYDKVKCYDSNGAPFTPKFLSDEFAMELTDYNNCLEYIESLSPLPLCNTTAILPFRLRIPTLDRC